jgi:hypothetical protein
MPEVIVHFARSMGSGRSGDVETARQELATLTAIQAWLKDQKGFDCATQVAIERRTAPRAPIRAHQRSLRTTTASADHST